MTTAELDPARFERLLEAFDGLRLLVVGDVMVDEYVMGAVERVSPEAPVPVVQVQDESQVLGGAGNLVRNVIALGAGCLLAGVVGDDLHGRQVVDWLKDLGVDPQGIGVVGDRPTTRKTRLLARAQQMVRVDRESTEPLPAESTSQLLAWVAAVARSVDGAVLEDYGKGLFTPDFTAELMRRLAAARVPVAVDPKGSLDLFRGAWLVKPNLSEAQALTGIAARDEASLGRIAAALCERVGTGDVAISRGRDGITILPAGGTARRVATAAQDVFDRQGAGDTTIAALALARLAGATLLEAAVIANAAAGVVVEKVGTATATRDEVRLRLPAALAAAREHT